MSDLIEKILLKLRWPRFDITKPIEVRCFTCKDSTEDYTCSTCGGTKRTLEEVVYLRRFYIFRSKRFNVYLHRFHRSDDDPDPHDHPWDFWSFILSKGYREQIWAFCHDDSLDRAGYIRPDPIEPDQFSGSRDTCPGALFGPHYEEVKAGDIAWHAATHVHRVLLRPGEKPWTLVITGPTHRPWGFARPTEWVFWREYLNNWSKDHA